MVGTNHLGVALTITEAIPVITSAATAFGTAGSSFSYSITATNSPTGAQRNRPASGLALNAGTGVISGIPAIFGPYNVTIKATSASGTGSAVLALTIIEPIPIVTSAANAAGTAASSFSAITASNSPTSYTAVGLPAGLSLNPTTGVIAGIPVFGIFNVAIGATNAGGTGSALVALTIIEPSPIIISAAAWPSRIELYLFNRRDQDVPRRAIMPSVCRRALPSTRPGCVTGIPSVVGVFNITIGATSRWHRLSLAFPFDDHSAQPDHHERRHCARRTRSQFDLCDHRAIRRRAMVRSVARRPVPRPGNGRHQQDSDGRRCLRHHDQRHQCRRHRLGRSHGHSHPFPR